MVNETDKNSDFNENYKKVSNAMTWGIGGTKSLNENHENWRNQGCKFCNENDKKNFFDQNCKKWLSALTWRMIGWQQKRRKERKQRIGRDKTGCVANLFKPELHHIILEPGVLKLYKFYTSYNNRFLHGSQTYIISLVWNQWPLLVKNAPNVSSFRRLLNKINFTGCQCSNYLWLN